MSGQNVREREEKSVEMHARGVWQNTLTVYYNVGLIIKYAGR